MGSILGWGSWVSFAGPFSRDPLAWVGEVEVVVYSLVLLVGFLARAQSGDAAADLIRVCVLIVRIRMCLVVSLWL